MPAPHRPKVVPADVRQWSEESQGSVPANWTTEYHDIEYNCRSCRRLTVFTAQDQKYTYEVKKASIDQHRVLCEDCWRQSLEMDSELQAFSQRWAAERQTRRTDRDFLLKWLLLLELRQWLGARADTAKKNMLKKLLNDS